MKPIAFMRLRQLDRPEDILRHYKPKDLAVEQKYDGFKVMASRGPSGTKLYSRNGKDLTAKAPAIVKQLDRLLPNGTTVLGEMVYIANGQQELGLVQSVLHSAAASRAIAQAHTLGGLLEFIVYDCLEYKLRPLEDEPWSIRRSHMERVIPAASKGGVRRSKVYSWSKRKDAMRDSLKAGGEGIVVKVKSSPYIYRKSGASEPHGQWWKHKVPGEKAHTEDVILCGYAKREKRLAFKMYQLDQGGNRVFVGYVSNLPRITERSVQKMSDKGQSVVAEISHQERFASGKFRHPGWIRLRPDKPLKSATFVAKKKCKMPKSNPTMRRSDYNVYVAQKLGDDIHLYTFSSRDFVQPTANALSYQMLLASANRAPIESTHVVMGDAALRKLLRKTKGRIIRGKKFRQSNPRNSKVKDALAIEATRHDKFEAFAKSYWDACARGLYWVATDEKKFYIGQHERAKIDGSGLEVFCSPELALAGKHEKKKYVAELDVTKLPGSSLRVVKGTDGSKIRIVGSAGSVKVTRVLDASRAKNAWKWQLSILPSSKEELRRVWEDAWSRRRREVKMGRIRREKQEERERKRAESKREKEQAAKAREEKERARKTRLAKASREKRGRAARKTAEKREGAAKTKKKKGKWVRVPAAPKPNPGDVLVYVNNPECER